MSREVIGDAPVEAERSAPSVTPRLPRPPAGRPEGIAVDVRVDAAAPRRRVRRRTIVAGLALLTAVSATAGYLRADGGNASGTGVTAAVVAATRVAAGSSDPRGQARAVLTVGLVNPGRQDVRVQGWVTDDRLGSSSFAAPRATVPARGRIDITVDLPLRCDRPQELGMPALRLGSRAPGGRSLQPVGAAAALTDLCASVAPVMKSLRAFRLDRSSGGRLVVELGTQDRRPTRIEAVSAGSVPLDVGPLPARVGGAYPLILRPPATCPNTWTQHGLPTALQIQLDSGRGPATVTVKVGPALTRWILETSCWGLT